MKKQIILIVIICLVSLINTNAQGQSQLNEQSVVLDSASGKRYAYEDWRKLLMTGDYTIKLVSKNVADGFLLIKLSDEAIAKRDSLAPKPRESAYFTTGKPFSQFNETDINGIKWNLKKLKGKIVVLNFWFINCPPCRAEMPSLNKVVNKYSNDPNIMFISFALDGEADIQNFLKTNPFNYNTIADAKSLCAGLGVNSYPTHVVIDKEGVVQYHTSGLSVGTIPWLVKTIERLKSN